jgi:hypothetical protein
MAANHRVAAVRAHLLDLAGDRDAARGRPSRRRAGKHEPSGAAMLEAQAARLNLPR